MSVLRRYRGSFAQVGFYGRTFWSLRNFARFLGLKLAYKMLGFTVIFWQREAAHMRRVFS